MSIHVSLGSVLRNKRAMNLTCLFVKEDIVKQCWKYKNEHVGGGKVRYENIIPVLGILPYYTLAIKNQKSELVIISDTVIAVRRSDLLGLHTAPAFSWKAL